MFELLQFPFFQRALVIGIILSFTMALLGVFIVLRRMSFFSDAIGHSALTGIALGILLNINPFIAAFIFSIFVAVGITYARFRSRLSLDTLLGVFFSAAVALGVILVQLTPGFQTNLINFLFGNILTVGQSDVYLASTVSFVVIATLIFYGKSLVAIAFDENLARAEGVPVVRQELLFLILLAAVIAVSIKIIGVILVTAMLVIPAATAQNITRSMSSMFAASVVVGLLATISGMLLSVILNTASGPTIILTGALLFAISLALRPLIKTAS